MKKYFSLILVLMFSFLIIFETLPVSAEKVHEFTYEENFEYGDTDIVPLYQCGEAEILKEGNNHFLHLKGNEVMYTLACFGPYVADFDISFKIRQQFFNSEWSYSKFLFHSDWGEHLTYRLNLYSYKIQGDHIAPENSKILAENSNVKFAENTWYTILVCARGSEYTVFVDGEKVLKFAYEVTPEGCFGFAGWQTEFDVDDISIIEYSDNEAPPVSEIVEGTDDGEAGSENEINKIIDVKRNIRKMKETFVSFTESVDINSSGRKIIIISAFAVASILAVLFLGFIYIGLIKKKKE